MDFYLGVAYFVMFVITGVATFVLYTRQQERDYGRAYDPGYDVDEAMVFAFFGGAFWWATIPVWLYRRSRRKRSKYSYV